MTNRKLGSTQLRDQLLANLGNFSIRNAFAAGESMANRDILSWQLSTKNLTTWLGRSVSWWSFLRMANEGPPSHKTDSGVYYVVSEVLDWLESPDPAARRLSGKLRKKHLAVKPNAEPKDLALCLVSRKFSFEAGHRLPDHKGKCSHVHGHSWQCEVFVIGHVVEKPGESDHGMVVDFAVLKQLIKSEIVDQWDHGFLVWRDDSKMVTALKQFGTSHRTIKLDFIPTSENIARAIFERITGPLAKYRCSVYKVKVSETANSSAVYVNPAYLLRRVEGALKGE